MQTNEIIEQLMAKVYIAEAGNLHDVVGDVVDSIGQYLQHQELINGEEAIDEDEWRVCTYSLGMRLQARLQRLMFADGRAGRWLLSVIGEEQLVATALGYLALYHTGQNAR